MPTENSTRLAEQILDDQDGVAHYADPAVLGDLLATQLGAQRGSRTADAGELLGRLARRYVKHHGSDEDDTEELARWLEGLWIR